MRGFFFSLLCFGAILGSRAQEHELGVFLGMSNYVGDIGEMTYIKPDNFAYGIVYKWNKHPRFALRGSLMFANLKGDDDNSDLGSRLGRGLSFENNIMEVNAAFEFNFIPFEPYLDQTQTTPYVATGLSYFFMDQLRYPSSTNSVAEEYRPRKGDVSIPLMLGVKSNFLHDVILGFEIGARYAFSDNLDGSFPSYSNAGIGNTNSNDWYFFTGITATILIGKSKKCYCYN
ncbi:hypothetical protein SAMN05216480_105197 [Pustulibacterium marinum]|uniref:DUF6089 domain-containing protein n=1 Tax=Pustulibacterium marinum TaxID=1224947 RepID=A0A1I7GR53_9FLAO|nr:DUF6089 family protein [Pustulibacterium marinum]SFU50920.1 hypothetical protein SAMN05216480_105197 [Pustulibacterium marinum]